MCCTYLGSMRLYTACIVAQSNITVHAVFSYKDNVTLDL